MAFYKATWFLQSNPYAVGWTENWWVSASTAVDALANVANYKTVRAALLSDQAQITTLRVSNVDPPRDSLFDSTGLPLAGGILAASFPIAGVWDALLCRRDITLNTLLGHMFMHFVPANIFTGRAYNPGGGSGESWATKFAAFQTEVTSGAYFLREKGVSGFNYLPCSTFFGQRRTEHKLGRPSDGLRGRRAVA